MWWYSTHIHPGDQMFHERMFTDYKLAHTKFVGPTVFQRGDLIARSCSAIIRYLAKQAEKRGVYAASAGAAKKWTSAELAAIEQLRRDWFMSNREGKPRTSRPSRSARGARSPSRDRR